MYSVFGYKLRASRLVGLSSLRSLCNSRPSLSNSFVSLLPFFSMLELQRFCVGNLVWETINNYLVQVVQWK